MTVQSLPLGPIGTNCYLVKEDTSPLTVVVDPGDDGERLVTKLRGENRAVAAILLTHGHYDHTGAVAQVLAAYPTAQVYIHQADTSAEPGVMLQWQPVTGCQFYTEGDVLTFGTLSFHVYHTPGHSPGSVTLQCGDVLFTGDTLFRGSIGRTDFPNGSYPTIMQSLARLGKLSGDYKVCPGHEECSTLGDELRMNYYLREAMGK